MQYKTLGSVAITHIRNYLKQSPGTRKLANYDRNDLKVCNVFFKQERRPRCNTIDEAKALAVELFDDPSFHRIGTGAQTKAKGAKGKKHNKKSKGRTRRRWNRHRSKSQCPFRIRDQILCSMGYSSYKSYLGSRLYRRIKQSVSRIHGDSCVCCGKAKDVFHHTEYTLENLSKPGSQNEEHTIFPLCNDCHYKVHREGKKFVSLEISRVKFFKMRDAFQQSQTSPFAPNPPSLRKARPSS